MGRLPKHQRGYAGHDHYTRHLSKEQRVSAVMRLSQRQIGRTNWTMVSIDTLVLVCVLFSRSKVFPWIVAFKSAIGKLGQIRCINSAEIDW